MATMVETRRPLEKFKDELSLYTGSRSLCQYVLSLLTAPLELSSEALGATITSVSDEFFAEAFHLLKVEVRRQ